MREFCFFRVLHPLPALWSRNPLVRAVDRVEALALMVLATIVVAFMAVAGAVGTSQYDARSRAYADETKGSHVVTATALEDSAVIVPPYTVVTVAKARWNASGVNHVDEFPYPERLKTGDQFPIWVNGAGDQIAGPPSAGRAVNEASGIAVGSWLAVAAAASALAYELHRRLNRKRYAQWDRALTSLAGDDGNRTNQQP